MLSNDDLESIRNRINGLGTKDGNMGYLGKIYFNDCSALLAEVDRLKKIVGEK